MNHDEENELEAQGFEDYMNGLHSIISDLRTENEDLKLELKNYENGFNT
jgi:exonuclease VII small subunit